MRLDFNWFNASRNAADCLVNEAAIANAFPQSFTAVEEKPVAPGLSPEAIATLLLIFLNKKEGNSGGMTIQWGFRGYEYKDLGELTQKGLISNPVGGRDSKSLWLTPAGAALGNIIRDILLPELEKLAGSLGLKEVKG